MNSANTLFLILSSVLVLFMTPGLAFFYGGLVSKKNVVNTLMSVFIITGLAIILWVAFGYSMSFTGNFKGIVGNLHNFFMNGVHLDALTATGVPNGVFSLFEMMFAVITPALFVGAVVGRMNFKFLLVFTTLWSIFIYYPMVHMVWSPLGFLAKLGVLDFAGGTVVHINAGVTALILAVFLGHRLNYSQKIRQYSLPWVLLGTTILWIGWYGFNVGSAFAVNGVAVQAALTTTLSTASAMMTWMFLDMFVQGKPKLAGIANGTLCGLVGITPAAGFVTIAGSFWIGIIATLASYTFINYIKPRIKLDDTLDAFGCHGVSGITGSILTGCFATKLVNPAVINNGLFYSGGFHQLLVQVAATAFTIIFVAIIDIILIKIVNIVIPMRVTNNEEKAGLDQSEHGEKADHQVE
ncbi:ammonium transporter [Philodulcilactobacillus myokoensis]|uniref:Ammonium transporter n=1 Tax=Philodulcilactobacillus myokoensis TaxID=2929573 RepID=A0A9W6B1U3_9LACO|nr:ammonium transporter [Philodulcilactobacillus myokoensis]GLB47374.1 ammonium transporter [Philodulcilactobacillus myokoensis]